MTLPFYLSYGALWSLVILLSLVLLGLVRTVYRLQHAGLAANSSVAANGSLRGQPAPEFTATDLAGEPIRSTDFAGLLTALLFVGPDCETCALTLRDLDALRIKAQRNLVVICRGDRDQCRQLSQAYRLSTSVILDPHFEISELFGITTLPTAVLIAEDGRVASYGTPMGRDDLEAMLAERRAEAEAEQVPAGRAPDTEHRTA